MINSDGARQRQRQREKERQRQRKRDRDRERETETEIEAEREQVSSGPPSPGRLRKKARGKRGQERSSIVNLSLKMKVFLQLEIKWKNGLRVGGHLLPTMEVESGVGNGERTVESPKHCGPEQPTIQTKVLGHSLVCSLVRSHPSLVCLLCTTCFARALCLLARSLCSLPRSWESEQVDGYIFCVFFSILARCAKKNCTMVMAKIGGLDIGITGNIAGNIGITGFGRIGKCY